MFLWAVEVFQYFTFYGQLKFEHEKSIISGLGQTVCKQVKSGQIVLAILIRVYVVCYWVNAFYKPYKAVKQICSDQSISIIYHNRIFDEHAGAGASSTSVGPFPGNWLAARIADLTPDLQVLLS